MTIKRSDMVLFIILITAAVFLSISAIQDYNHPTVVTLKPDQEVFVKEGNGVKTCIAHPGKKIQIIC